MPNTASLLEALARFDVANYEDLNSPASDLPQLTRFYSSALYKSFRSRRARARFAIACAAGTEKTRRDTMLEELSMTVLDEEFSAALSAARALFSAASKKEKLTCCFESPGVLSLARQWLLEDPIGHVEPLLSMSTDLSAASWGNFSAVLAAIFDAGHQNKIGNPVVRAIGQSTCPCFSVWRRLGLAKWST